MTGDKTKQIRQAPCSLLYRAQFSCFQTLTLVKARVNTCLSHFSNVHFVRHKYKLSCKEGSKFQYTGTEFPLDQSVDCSLDFLGCQDNEGKKKSFCKTVICNLISVPFKLFTQRKVRKQTSVKV